MKKTKNIFYFLIISVFLIFLAFFSLLSTINAYKSKTLNCNKITNECEIVNSYLYLNKNKITKFKLSEITNIDVAFHSGGPRGGNSFFSLDIITPNDIHTFIKVTPYYKNTIYTYADEIRNFISSNKPELQLVYNVSAFIPVMNFIILSLIILGAILAIFFKKNIKKYKNWLIKNKSKHKAWINFLPVSITMLLLSIFSTWTIQKSLIIEEKQIGLNIGLFYVFILAVISLPGIYQLFLFNKKEKVNNNNISIKKANYSVSIFSTQNIFLHICSILLIILIFLAIFLITWYGFGMVGLFF